MSKHLNADQMAEWVAGERCPEWERHLVECSGCLLAVEELQTALGGWRDAVRGWSDRQYQIAESRMAERQAVGTFALVSQWAHARLYWTAGATAMCAVLALLVWYSQAIPAGQRSLASPALVGSTIADTGHRTEAAGRQLNADAVLMRQVDREVSQTVPDAMEPLMGLVSWDGATGDEGTPNDKRTSKQVE